MECFENGRRPNFWKRKTTSTKIFNQKLLKEKTIIIENGRWPHYSKNGRQP